MTDAERREISRDKIFVIQTNALYLTYINPTDSNSNTTNNNSNNSHVNTNDTNDIIPQNNIATYLLTTAEQADLNPYVPFLELLRWMFVPSIDHRVLTLLEHFVYNDARDSSCHESAPETFLCDMDVWLEEASSKLDQLLRPNGLSRIFVDSVLMGNRIERIGRQLDNLDFDCPRWDWTDTCRRMMSVDYCAERYQSTQCLNHVERPAGKNGTSESEPRQSRKRKATYEEIPAEDQTERTKGAQQSRSDKLRLVVTKQLPSRAEEGCRRRRRTDYLRLPCDCRALKEKVFRYSKHSGKLDERLKHVCSCLNNVVDRMDDEVVSDAKLSCEVRENYVKFKLGRIRSNLCMFATRLALRSGRRKDKRRDNDGVSRGTNGSASENHFEHQDSEDARDKGQSSRVNETACSTRFLWNPSRHCFATSSVEDDSSADEANDFPSTCRNDENSADLNAVCEDKNSRNNDNSSNCGCNLKNCPCSPTKSSERRGSAMSSKSKETKRCHFQQTESPAERRLDDLEARDCNKISVVSKDAEMMTDEVDAPMELTNIYVNEISICCCSEKYDALEDTGVNTECNSDGKCCLEASTNTEDCQSKEMSTQVFFRGIQFCACYKNTDEEFEIENVGLENQECDATCEWNKETTISGKLKVIEVGNKITEKSECKNDAPFDEIVQHFGESTCKSSEFTDMMKVKINEIVDLNERIRKKVTMIKGKQDVCSVSVQTLIRQQSRESVNTKIHVQTSVLSFKSNISAKTCATKPSSTVRTKPKESCRTTSHSIRLCEKSTHTSNNVEEGVLKKSILTEITASLENPVLQRLRTDVIYQRFRMSQSSSLSDSCCRSDSTSSLERICICGRQDSCEEDKSVQHTCRCTKKNNFLNYLSEHLTRDSFEKFKRIVRLILKKLLEKAKMLNDLRKSRASSECHCSFCGYESFSSFEECYSETTTCSYAKNSSRLSGGAGDGDGDGDGDYTGVSRKHPRGSNTAKFTRSALACRDADYTTATSQSRYRKRRRSRRKTSRHELDTDNGLRRCRTEIFATRAVDSCAAHRRSLAFAHSSKYCYVR